MSYFAATSRQEQRYCQLFASKVFTGLGRIVEFGPWLGSLTKALGRGLAVNPRIKKIFHMWIPSIVSSGIHLWRCG